MVILSLVDFCFVIKKKILDFTNVVFIILDTP